MHPLVSVATQGISTVVSNNKAATINNTFTVGDRITTAAVDYMWGLFFINSLPVQLSFYLWIKELDPATGTSASDISG